jgi:hypothetical protein
MSNSNVVGRKDGSRTTSTDHRTGNGLTNGTSMISSNMNTRQLMNSLQDAEMFKNPIEVPVNHTDLSLILRKRLERINHEMDDFTLIVCNFSLAVDYELEKFVKDMAELQHNLNRINGYKSNKAIGGVTSGEKK